MKLKTYQSWTMAEALAFVKTDLGADAVILHTRTFERGGFFGFGRRSVVEITAARAQDMPRVEPRAKRPLTASSIASSTASSAASSASADRTADPLRVSAAARAYGAQSTAYAPPSAAARSADAPMSMEVDREKTRRLAQAMSISLEKQAAARAIASRNEDAVREAAAAIDARMAAAAKPDNQPIDGPAQRFVLMPDAANGGAQRLTAAVLRTPDSSRAPETAGMPEFSRLASQSASHPASQSASTPVVQASSVAASISPTHSSVDAVSAFVEAKPAARESELDAISEFVGRVLKRGGAEGQTVASAAATATAASTATSAAPSAASSAGTWPASPSRPRSIEAAHAHLLEAGTRQRPRRAHHQ